MRYNSIYTRVFPFFAVVGCSDEDWGYQITTFGNAVDEQCSLVLNLSCSHPVYPQVDGSQSGFYLDHTYGILEARTIVSEQIGVGID